MDLIFFMKVICVIGFIFMGWLMLSDVARRRKTSEGKELWDEGLKHWKWNAMVGVIANFLDTLGIGSFATSSALFKLKKSVDDINIPGTLNAGDTFPVLTEAFLFFGFVDVDALTLVSMLAAAVVGAYIGAGIVTKWNRHYVRIGMGCALIAVGIIMASKQLAIGPFGLVGYASGLTGIKLVIGVVVNFFLGALMSIGVGLYAPCLALVSMLGMNVKAAFPIMMGSCAYLMAFGNSPKFVREGRYDMVASLCQGAFGVVGVCIAYYLVKSLPLTVLLWGVICVVFYTAIAFLHDAAKDGSAKAN